jgi:hypothetical protein
MTEERVLFRSLGDAMIWAWYLARAGGGMVKGPSYAQFIKSDERSADDAGSRSISGVYTSRQPTGLDGAAQAGMIKRFVHSMNAVSQCHLMAAMLRAEDRAAAQREMAIFVLKQLEGAPDTGLVTELVRKHYGARGLSMVALAKKYEIDRRKVSGIRAQVEITLDAIAFRAETDAYEHFQKMGVIA